MTDRQRNMENNRSLRTIKNELESLLERGVISDNVFDTVMAQLPAEAALSSAAPSPSPLASMPLALPPRNPAAPRTPSAMAAAAASTLANLRLSPSGISSSNNKNSNSNPSNTQAPAPPAYSQTPPPALPSRNHTAPPPPPPEKPVLMHARAVYAYAAVDARDVGLEYDDRIAVYDYVNDQWWMGRNMRTGQEGIFPKTYVVVEAESEKQRPPPPPVPGSYSTMGPVSTATMGNVGGPPPPGGAVYDPNAPPPGQEKESKLEGTGKKFGKKLGNAAIFGAGATIGSNLVNSIF